MDATQHLNDLGFRSHCMLKRHSSSWHDQIFVMNPPVDGAGRGHIIAIYCIYNVSN